jgi:peptidoglycan-associated lipoprotein
MKRVFFILVVFFAMQTAFAQEKGLHLTVGGGLGKTNFAYDLEDGSRKGGIGLDRKVALMKKYPQAVITVIGHTCDKGNSGYNDILSYNRAETARVYLIKSGINDSRIISVPMGMKNPTYTNILEHNRELNRRVDFIIAK